MSESSLLLNHFSHRHLQEHLFQFVSYGGVHKNKSNMSMQYLVVVVVQQY